MTGNSTIKVMQHIFLCLWQNVTLTSQGAATGLHAQSSLSASTGLQQGVQQIFQPLGFHASTLHISTSQGLNIIPLASTQTTESNKGKYYFLTILLVKYY